MTIELNPQFTKALLLMEQTRSHVFITGEAGTGKSTLLEYFKTKTKKKPVILAPTGVAALNVKGQTIHRFFHFYIDVTPQKIEQKQIRPRNKKLYQNLEILIIDEASMLRADLLDCIDIFLRLYGPKPGKIFGGVQIILVGDLYQLPPVVLPQEKEIFTQHYQTPYFFSARAFEQIQMQTIILKKVYRQKDSDFISLLNHIRNNSATQEDLEKLNTRLYSSVTIPDGSLHINLTPTNKKADQINDTHLEALTTPLYQSEAVIEGDFEKPYYPTNTSLSLKEGAQIMLLNNDPKKRWVNGSIGIIQAINTDPKEGYLRVHLQNSATKIVHVPRFTWEVYRFSVEEGQIISKPAGTFMQFPVRLAWAVTIHKSQGKTFNHMILDLDQGTFAAGQLYVALSRCTSLEGLILKKPIYPYHIKTDQRIMSFFKNNRL